MSTVTAGHCFPVNGDIKSGPKAYGFVNGRAPYPQWHMMLIFTDFAAGQAFQPKIHTGPSAPTTRTQTGKSDLAVNQFFCKSGRVTGSMCGFKVVSTTAQLCDPAGCTTGLVEGTKNGQGGLWAHGDSGGPIYSPAGATGAKIHGLFIGGKLDFTTVVYHPVSAVESKLGVSVAF